jgi:hypothetical protein
VVPSEFELDMTATPDLEAARAQANAAGLPELELRAVIDDRFPVAGEVLQQQLGQIGVHLLPEPMPGQAIVQQGAGLAEQGFDLVIAGRDVVDQANAAAEELLPAEEQVEL